MMVADVRSPEAPRRCTPTGVTDPNEAAVSYPLSRVPLATMGCAPLTCPGPGGMWYWDATLL